jgi:hypothetical protein
MAVEDRHASIANSTDLQQMTPRLKTATTSELDAYTGSKGELYYDTDLDLVKVMDGSTAGGAAVGAQGSMSLLASDTLSAASSLNINEFASQANCYLMIIDIEGMTVSDDDTDIVLTVHKNGGEKTAGNYTNSYYGLQVGAGAISNGSTTDTSIHLTRNAAELNGVGNATNEVFNCQIMISRPNDAVIHHVRSRTVYNITTGAIVDIQGHGVWLGTDLTDALDSVTLAPAAGTFSGQVNTFAMV